MAFESWNKLMICDDGIENIDAKGIKVGYEFKLQYPSYRGTFLSCIEEFEVKVDGKKIAREDIGFAINNKEVLISEFSELFREYWFTLDKATIKIYQAGGLKLDSKHKVYVRMLHRIPYTGYFGNYMIGDSVCEKELIVE